ncbi:MAG TPA: peptidylprolyl isomerase, partial [Phycisphaerales bacterium]|nr:peptidylprolyl isomerase [Phycisphaerales bacterium]
TSQFFINTVDNPALDPANNRFAVFGRVIQGWSVIEAIAALNRVNATTDAAFAGQFSGNFANLPVTSNYNAQTGVRENALVTFENVEVIKPTELAGFFSQELVTPEGFRSNFTTESVDMYNPNSVATRYQIIARYEVGGKDDGFNSGSRDQVIASGVINANSKARVQITSTSTSFTDLTRNGAYAIVAQFGFAETATNVQPVAAAITRDDFGTSTSEAFVNPSAFTSPQLREWTFARIERNPDSLEYMLFYNLSDTTATVTTEFVTPNGLRAVTRVIPAFTRSGIGIAEQGFGEGILAARVTSTQDIVATLTDWDIVVPTATVPRVAIPSYMVNGSAGGGSSVGSISRVVRPSTGVSELSFYNSGNTTANVNILYTGLTPLGATSVSVLPNTRVTVALDQGPTDTPVSVLFDAGLTPVTAQYTSLPEVFFPTPGLPSFRVDGFANQFASSVPTIATFAQGLFETSSNSGTSTEVVSIFNPLQSIAMTYTVTYRFSDGTSITGATGTLNGRNAIDITTQGLSNVVTKINSGANFRNYAVIVTGSANLTGGTSAFAGITNLTRVDTRTAKAVMSGPFVNGVALALSSTDVFPVVNN